MINSADQARQAVRYNIKHGADVIKTCATGGVLSLTDDVDTPQLTQAELDALVDEAHALRRKTAAHAHGATGAKRAIRAGIDSIEHGSFLDDEALDMMKARGTFYVPTLMAAEGPEGAADGRLPSAGDRGQGAPGDGGAGRDRRKAIARGVKIVVGTDATVYPHGRNAGEFHLLVESRDDTHRRTQGRHLAGRRTPRCGGPHRHPGDREIRRHRGLPGQSGGGYPAGGKDPICDERGCGLPKRSVGAPSAAAPLMAGYQIC